ncbi:MAG: hypothetical protein IPH20_25030 [Bacteroidales bacterium]|nr:hypothetical protein [Bacteroidales bacterium]
MNRRGRCKSRAGAEADIVKICKATKNTLPPFAAASQLKTAKDETRWWSPVRGKKSLKK